jgi:hypothetical protein
VIHQIQNCLVYGKSPLTSFKVRHALGHWLNAEASFRLLPSRQILIVTRLSSSSNSGTKDIASH